MKRDYRLYLDDIEESVRQIEEYMKGVTEEQFKKDKKLQDAVVRRLEIIGEAGKNIPGAFKEHNKSVPWREISNYRDFIMHSYFEISIQRLWNAATKGIKEIKEGMKNLNLV